MISFILSLYDLVNIVDISVENFLIGVLFITFLLAGAVYLFPEGPEYGFSYSSIYKEVERVNQEIYPKVTKLHVKFPSNFTKTSESD